MGALWEFSDIRERSSSSTIFSSKAQDLIKSKRKISKRFIQTLTLESIREFKILSADPSQQIMSTLSYFSQHPDLLDSHENSSRHKENRWLLEHLLFESPLLMEMLLAHPSEVNLLVGKLSNFLKSMYKYLETDNNKEFTSFLLRVHRILQEYISTAAKHHPENFSKDLVSKFLDVKKKIRKFISKTSSSSMKHSLNARLFMTFQNKKDPLTEEDAKDFLIGHIAAQSFDDSLNVEDNVSPMERRDVFDQHQSRIRELLSDNEIRNAILNEVVGEYISELPSEMKWEPYEQLPLFIAKTEEKQVVIDVKRGGLWGLGGELQSFPYVLYSDPQISSLGLLSSSNTQIQAIDHQWWFIKTPDQTQYRIKVNDGSPPVIQKKYRGLWFELSENFHGIAA